MTGSGVRIPLAAPFSKKSFVQNSGKPPAVMRMPSDWLSNREAGPAKSRGLLQVSIGRALTWLDQISPRKSPCARLEVAGHSRREQGRLLKLQSSETIVAGASTTQTTTLVAVAGVLGTLLGATVSPLVNYLTNERQVDVKMLEIGLGILREPPKEDAQTMRAWAIEIIEKSSGRPFSEQQRDILLKKELAVRGRIPPDDTELTTMLLMLQQSIQQAAGKPVPPPPAPPK
jgi:hypothetical protein